jgi:hypothetical protein
MRGIKIDGFIGIPDTMTDEEWMELFLEWLKDNGCEFGEIIDDDSVLDGGYDA